MPRKRKKRYVYWRPTRHELGFERDAQKPYPFNEMDRCQRHFLAAICKAPSPRAAMRKANATDDVASWLDQPAFFTALHITLRRRFGRDRAAQMLTVLFRFLLHQPLEHACELHGPGGFERKPFFSQED